MGAHDAAGRPPGVDDAEDVATGDTGSEQPLAERVACEVLGGADEDGVILVLQQMKHHLHQRHLQPQRPWSGHDLVAPRPTCACHGAHC